MIATIVIVTIIAIILIVVAIVTIVPMALHKCTDAHTHISMCRTVSAQGHQP